MNKIEVIENVSEYLLQEIKKFDNADEYQRLQIKKEVAFVFMMLSKIALEVEFIFNAKRKPKNRKGTTKRANRKRAAKGKVS
ncbi:MAG TPA: hypothetical protein DCE71_07890 [Parachlamydiales bacterium]|nr:hypothetical protein [Parachlamydiales bacterium]